MLVTISVFLGEGELVGQVTKKVSVIFHRTFHTAFPMAYQSALGVLLPPEY